MSAGLDDRLRRLSQAVAQVAPAGTPDTGSLDRLCEDVLRRLVPREKGDDVALLAARLVRT